jgi:hypothetical protein
MLLVFLRHGSVAALLVGAAAEGLAWLFGVVALQPVLILLGALLFYLSEYGMHRFAFHAPPLVWPRCVVIRSAESLKSPGRAACERSIGIPQD